MLRLVFAIACACWALLHSGAARGATSCASMQLEGPPAGANTLEQALATAGFAAQKTPLDGDVILKIREATRDCRVSLEVTLRFWSEAEETTLAERALPRGRTGALSDSCVAPGPTAEHWRSLAAEAAARVHELAEMRSGRVRLASDPTPARLRIERGTDPLWAATPFERGCLLPAGISGQAIFGDGHEKAFSAAATAKPEAFLIRRHEPERTNPVIIEPVKPSAWQPLVTWARDNVAWGTVLPFLATLFFFSSLYLPRFTITIRRADFDADGVCTRLVLSVTQTNSRVRITVSNELALAPPDAPPTRHELEDLEPVAATQLELPKGDLEGWKLRRGSELVASVACKHGPRALRALTSKPVRLRVESP